ncbi:hypothetical protein C8Q80DRAFT_1112988, partial [Daedaleopsis nitida]
MSTTVKLGNDDSVRVPRLEASGGNWVLFKARLTWAADVKGVAGHLDGTSQEPTAPAGATALTVTAAPATGTAATTTTATTTTAATLDPSQVQYETDLATWRKGEVVLKQLLASTIPDSLFMKIRGHVSAHAIW